MMKRRGEERVSRSWLQLVGIVVKEASPGDTWERMGKTKKVMGWDEDASDRFSPKVASGLSWGVDMIDAGGAKKKKKSTSLKG